ncbi:MAG: NADH-quinone oxidoreductase subunit C [Actinomycetota bacterium]
MPSADAPETEEATEVVSDEARESLLEAITAELGDAVVGTHMVPGRDLWIRVTTPAWADTADYLRNRQRFRFFDWLSAVDWLPSPFGRSLTADVDDQLEGDADDDADAPADPVDVAAASYAGGGARFQVMARVYSLATGIGINVKTDVDDQLAVPSWVGVYPGASWHEREAFEMFGIEFDGHPDLRKLYLPGDFEGYPLRKDYPLLARIIKPWPGIVDVEPMPEVEEAPAAPAPESTPEGPSTTNPEDAS